MKSLREHLASLALDLPNPAAPLASYVPFTKSGSLVFIAGQLPLRDGKIVVSGRLGDNVSVDLGYEAAQLCALNLVAHLAKAVDDDISRVVQCVRIGGFVASSPDFTEHSKVINGASDLMTRIFGDAGRHARAAVGVSAIPFGAAVEVEGIFEIKDR